MGRAHGPDAAVRPDPAPDRPAPDPRGDDAAGLPDAQGFELKVRMPERTFGTLDHIIPTTDQTRPYADPLAEEMAVHMIQNMKEFNLPLFDMSTGKQGIVHVIGPELGLSQPGMTIACGDSHT